MSYTINLFILLLILIINSLLVTCSDILNDEPVPLYINEFMVRNSASSAYADCLGNHEDWVELYNGGEEPLDMSDFYISDKRDNLLKTQLHDTVINPGQHYLLWGGDFVCEHNNHIGFNFDATDTAKNEMILIVNDDGFIIDSISYLAIPEACKQDTSYGRSPDGSNTWKQQTTPTPGTANMD